MANILGTPGNDVLSGTRQADRIEGLEGEDALFGLAGDDTLLGGPGNNLLFGGNGNDSLFNSDGNDTVNGGDGNDFIQDGPGNDLLFGEKGNDIFFGGEGSDTLSGGDGDDFLRGRGQVEAGPALPDGNDYITGGRGNDLLVGDRGNDQLFGNQDNDVLIGVDDSRDDNLAGIGEIDRLTGNQGRDRFVLGDRDEIFYNDNNINSSGVQDYALITDFETTIDTIQLKGSASDYTLDNSFTLNNQSGTGIFLNEEVEELIGFAPGVNNLDINSSDFLFVD